MSTQIHNIYNKSKIQFTCFKTFIHNKLHALKVFIINVCILCEYIYSLEYILCRMIWGWNKILSPQLHQKKITAQKYSFFLILCKLHRNMLF